MRYIGIHIKIRISSPTCGRRAWIPPNAPVADKVFPQTRARVSPSADRTGASGTDRTNNTLPTYLRIHPRKPARCVYAPTAASIRICEVFRDVGSARGRMRYAPSDGTKMGQVGRRQDEDVLELELHCAMEQLVHGPGPRRPLHPAQESWHKQLLISKIPGMFRGERILCVSSAARTKRPICMYPDYIYRRS